MIAPSVIDSIRDLLADDRLSQRQIAQQLGVSRGVVAAVAEGRRPDYAAIRRRREESKQPVVLGPLRRCPTCGGMVHRPCRLCALREELTGAPPRVMDRRPIEPMGLELRGEARARYEAIHLRRMQQGEPVESDEAEVLDEAEVATDLDEWLEDEAPWS
jgi:hypothetical protein